MKALVTAILLGALSLPDVFATVLINDSFQFLPPGTLTYHAKDATLKSVSSPEFDKKTEEDRITVKFSGEWKIDSGSSGLHIWPQAGVVVGADTSERKRKLQELRSLCSSLLDRKVDIYIYAGAVNSDCVTYAWPDQIKIAPAHRIGTK